MLHYFHYLLEKNICPIHNSVGIQQKSYVILSKRIYNHTLNSSNSNIITKCNKVYGLLDRMSSINYSNNKLLSLPGFETLTFFFCFDKITYMGPYMYLSSPLDWGNVYVNRLWIKFFWFFLLWNCFCSTKIKWEIALECLLYLAYSFVIQKVAFLLLRN